MAQTSRYGGPSITPEEAADPFPPERPVRVRRPELGLVDREPYKADEEESPSATDGTDSSQSSESELKSGEKPKATPRKVARTTGNRSTPQETETASAASSTDGDTRKTETEFDEFGEFD